MMPSSPVRSRLLLRLRWLALAALPCWHGVHADDDLVQRIVVDGAHAPPFGLADAASAGALTARQLDARGAYRPGELLEAIPGLAVSQHGGEGKANQYLLRGFNLDHGTDLRTTLDDMPVNQRSHAHGQGWTDLNFLIPELVARLSYRKGPYSARDGDFASAGSVAIAYANRLPQALASVSAGPYGFGRMVAAGSPDLSGGVLLYGLEVLRNDGPFTRGDAYRKHNAVLRYSRGFANNGWNVSAMAYHATWNATDQVPLRAVQAGLLGRFDGLDPSSGGAAARYSVSGLWRRSASDSASRLGAYLVASRLELFSNFTYFLDDPVNGDQFAQPDRRVTAGAHGSHTWHLHLGQRRHDLTVGAQLQNDNIFNGLVRTAGRRPLATVRHDHLAESSAGLWFEASSRWSGALRTVAGLRADGYRFDAHGGRDTATAAIASPSASVIVSAAPLTELYVNAGHGFHSNDARTVVGGGARMPGQAALVRSRGAELGIRSAALAQLHTQASLYRLDVDSELVFVGDAGTTEAGAASRRVGIEWSNQFRAASWLTIELDAAYARARSRAGGARIAGAVEGVGQLALNADAGGAWSGALRLRYLGPRPLSTDNRVRSDASMQLNGRLAYRIGKTLRLVIEGFNLGDRADAAVAYYYASRLKGEAAPRADLHLHPVAPRMLRATLAVTW